MLKEYKKKYLEYKYGKIMSGCRKIINGIIQCGDFGNDGVYLCSKCNEKKLKNQIKRNKL